MPCELNTTQFMSNKLKVGNLFIFKGTSPQIFINQPETGQFVQNLIYFLLEVLKWVGLNNSVDIFVKPKHTILDNKNNCKKYNNNTKTNRVEK